MNRCKYYDKGNCKALGEKVFISCQTVSNSTPEICRKDNYSNHKRSNHKRKKYSKKDN